jgi:cyclophilin family peptidyl-prolyl cis-trans isomerase/protein-disulfide isomerase
MALKQFVVIVILGAVLLAGCAPGAASSSPELNNASQAQPFVATQTAPISAPKKQPGCTVKASSPTPNPTVESLLPPVTDEDWSRGPESAAVTILEYSDFQCPGCAGLTPILKRLEAKYPDELRIAFRHYPLTIHDKAALAAQAAEAAGKQDQFWKMHDALFEERDSWVDLSSEQFKTWVIDKADELGLDTGQFEEDMNSVEQIKLARDAYERNAALGMPGTPFLVINGLPYDGPLDFGNLDAMISLISIQERMFDDCPPMKIDPQKQYYAVLKTEKGDITLELFADKAPLAVNSFIFLAENDWFDGVTFHRVLSDFMAQAGDPSGTGYGGPGYSFDNEIDPGLTFDRPGVLAMANAGPGSNGSQFFITYAAAPHLDGGYTIFGKLNAGMDVLKKLTPRNPAESMELPPGDKILDVTIIEK